MKKHFVLLLAVLLSLGFVYSQVQVKKRIQPKPKLLQTIKVLSPNGGETWETGGRYTIRWTSKGIQGNIRIILQSPGRSDKIAERVPLTRGSYSYTIPANIPEGYKYKISIMTPDGKRKDASDGFFSIKTKKEIRIISPNGGEIWEQLREYTLRWASSGKIDNVTIQLENERGVSVHLLWP
ncbi:MAG: hypothetical protein GTN76_06985, partial [Candidatus Aenigmarchaeota archaeon]|nr:hypothetical protein [Candidatus Aenigmarchaeota archaeon]